MYRILQRVVILMAMTSGIAISAQKGQPPAMDPADQSATSGLSQDFQLSDQNKRLFSLKRLAGKWTFIYFGYTNCPDVCPTTTLTLNRLYEQLQQFPPLLANTQIVFVSVDPLRDTPDTVGRFIDYFNSNFIGVSGSRDQLSVLTEQLHIKYRLLSATNIKTGKKELLVEHGADVVLLDPETRIAGRFGFPHEVTSLLGAYLEVRDQYNRLRGEHDPVIVPSRGYIKPSDKDDVGVINTP